jgi:hypothetical protein
VSRVDRVVAVMMHELGFDSWWDDVDEATQDEIMEDLWAAVLEALNA